MLTELIIAGDEDLHKIISTISPLEEFPGADIKGVGFEDILTLHEIILGDPYDQLEKKYLPVAEASDDGPWVYKLPQELVAKIAQLDETELEDLALKWGGGAVGFYVSDGPEDSVLLVLKEFSGASKKAVREGLNVYVWFCL